MGAELSQFGDERPMSAVRWAAAAGAGDDSGGCVASGSWSGAIKTWRARDMKQLQRFIGHRERVCAVSWQPLPGDGECAVCQADISPPERVRLLPCRHVFHVLLPHSWFSFQVQ